MRRDPLQCHVGDTMKLYSIHRHEKTTEIYREASGAQFCSPDRVIPANRNDSPPARLANTNRTSIEPTCYSNGSPMNFPSPSARAPYDGGKYRRRDTRIPKSQVVDMEAQNTRGHSIILFRLHRFVVQSSAETLATTYTPAGRPLRRRLYEQREILQVYKQIECRTWHYTFEAQLS